MLPRQLIQPGRIGFKQGGHLVDKRAGAARAGFVHALINTAGKESQLGVFPAQFNGNISLRNHLAHRCAGGDDLLHERQLEVLGQKHGPGPGKGDKGCAAGKRRVDFSQNFAEACLDMGKMPLIAGKKNIPRPVHQHGLDGGGAYV